MYLEGAEIAIVGAGIGGLAAATALAQRRARVRVFERAETLGEVGAGLQVGPNAVAVLEALGLRSAAEQLASVPQAIELRDFGTGRQVVRLPLGAAAMARYGRPYWQFHRADLLDLLAEAAREAGAEIVTGAALRAALPDDDAVHLDFSDGRRARAGIVIGADGVRSGLRSSHLDGAAPRFTGHVAWRGLVPAEKLPEGVVPEAACVTMGPGRHLVTYPLRNGRLINFVAVQARDGWQAEGWMHPDDPAHLRAAFAGWSGLPEQVLGAATETFLWGLFDHPVLPVWARGRIALLGDACHPMLPFLAQGAAMALEDAWVLAAELDVAREPERGLMAYEARRKPRATRVQRASARNARIYHLDGPLRGVAHAGLRLGSALAPGAMLGRFDWLYGADVVSARATG